MKSHPSALGDTPTKGTSAGPNCRGEPFSRSCSACLEHEPFTERRRTAGKRKLFGTRARQDVGAVKQGTLSTWD